MRFMNREVESLVFWWSLGCAIAYLFLICLIVWLVFQGILLWNAYLSGDAGYIGWKLTRYLWIAVIYFSIAGFLRVIRFI
jgi:hypothetical protein